jgi:uncharacterized protein (TIGR02145 family)
MKIKAVIYAVLILGLMLSLLSNCKKDAIKTAPTVTISAATNITATTATSGGEVTADGGATVSSRGVCWSTNQNPTTSDSKTSNSSGTGSFSSSLGGLTPGATYYLKAYAINLVGTAYSSQATLTTLALLPVLTTTDPTSVTSTSASSGGNITNDGGATITSRGVCWSKSQNPTTSDSKTTDGTGSGSFTSSITGLIPGTTYYVRGYATNSIGTAYGNQITITTGTGTLIYAGRTYRTITINGKEWMAENLAYLPTVSPPSAGSDSAPYYYVYGYTGTDVTVAKATANYYTYGVLYNWTAAFTASPPGWHLPSDDEWKALEVYLGMTSALANAAGWRGTDQGGKLKEAGTNHWSSPNTGATNSSGFAALPGGSRDDTGTFFSIGSYVGGGGYWWSSTANDARSAWGRVLSSDYDGVDRYYFSKQDGFSVRCVQD